MRVNLEKERERLGWVVGQAPWVPVVRACMEQWQGWLHAKRARKQVNQKMKTVDIEDLGRVAPPCIAKMQAQLRKGQHLKYHQRGLYASVALKMGVPAERIFMFWRATCKDATFQEDTYRREISNMAKFTSGISCINADRSGGVLKHQRELCPFTNPGTVGEELRALGYSHSAVHKAQKMLQSTDVVDGVCRACASLLPHGPSHIRHPNQFVDIHRRMPTRSST